MKPRQVPIFLYWRVENVQFWINSIDHLGWLSCILNFPRFHENVNSLELWKCISENSSPKGSFWRNKRKSEFSSLSADSRYLLAVVLNRFFLLTRYTFKDWLISVKNKHKEIRERSRTPLLPIGRRKWRKTLLHFSTTKEWTHARKCRRYMDPRKKLKLVFLTHDSLAWFWR